MIRPKALPSPALLLLTLAMGCSGGRGVDNPAEPGLSLGDPTAVTSATTEVGERTQTHLWGYFDVRLDVENQRIEAVPNRNVEWTANVVTFLNSKLLNIDFYVDSTPLGTGWVEADFDVYLTHPLPDMPQYDGYDVRGVVIGNGSGTLRYNNDLKYADKAADQILVNPDGYTRWFNPTEFLTPGPLGYTRGRWATAKYTGNATLNPYKYFADSLYEPGLNLWDWAANSPTPANVFSSGASNDRNYYMHFPLPSPNVKFGYAVLATWKGEAPSDHPAFTPEAVACSVVDNSDLLYISPTVAQGNMVLDISVLGWEEQPSEIFIESNLLADPYQLTSEMTPTGGTEVYSTYHVEIPVNISNPSAPDEFWVIAQYDDFDYTNEFGVTNAAGTDKLAALFRYDLDVANPFKGWAACVGPESYYEEGDVAVDSTGNVYVTGPEPYVAKLSPAGKLLWQVDFEDLTIGYGVDVDGADNVYALAGRGAYSGETNIFKLTPDGEVVWHLELAGSSRPRGIVADYSGNTYVVGQYDSMGFDPGDGQPRPCLGYEDCFIAAYDTDGGFRWAHTFGGTSRDQAHGVALDGDRVFVSGKFQSLNVDMGVGPPVSSKGDWDVFVLALSTDGTPLWAKAFGGSDWDESRGMTASNGQIYVMGSFNSGDFDRGDGTKVSSKGWLDISVTAFDSSGKFKWSRTLSGTLEDRAWAIDAGGSGKVSVTGSFESLNFDPGNGGALSAAGQSDFFISTLSSDGAFQWARAFGTAYSDHGSGVEVGATGNVYVTGQTGGIVNFAPSCAPCNEPICVRADSSAFVVKYEPDGCW